MTNWKVPLADLDIGEAEVQAVAEVLRSKWLSMGPVTAEFERHFAEYIGAKYAFAVANCTAALHLAHLALGAGPGDTVICPSLTFVATANAIRYTGAIPVFADITSEDDLNVSPDDIEAKIDQTTKGICVMHYGGYPCDMERILDIARRHHLYVVEDAAHAPGAACWVTAGGQKTIRKCGNIGDIGCFSFFSNKNMTVGEGGMLTTNNADLADKIKLLRSHGMTTLTWDRDRGHSFSYDVVNVGYNYRIDEMRSALGLVQLNKLEKNNLRRAEISNIYCERLLGIRDIHLPFSKTDSISSHHIFPILLRKGEDKDHFMNMMKQKGIQTSMHYPPVHTFMAYKDLHQNHALPYTDDVGEREVTLPLYAELRREQIDAVVEAIQAWAISE